MADEKCTHELKHGAVVSVVTRTKLGCSFCKLDSIRARGAELTEHFELTAEESLIKATATPLLESEQWRAQQYAASRRDELFVKHLRDLAALLEDA